MSRLLGLLCLCVLLAVIQAVAVALVAAAVLALIYAFVTRPRQTFAFLATTGLVGLATARPTTVLVILAITASVVLVISSIRRHRPRYRRAPVILLGRDADPRA